MLKEINDIKMEANNVKKPIEIKPEVKSFITEACVSDCSGKPTAQRGLVMKSATPPITISKMKKVIAGTRPIF